MTVHFTGKKIGFLLKTQKCIRKDQTVSVILHELGDNVLRWPAHLDNGGGEIYCTGMTAGLIRTAENGDPWL